MPVLAGAVSPALLIPVHGCIQIVSNSSRALCSWHHIHKRILLPVLLGTGLGAGIALPLLQQVNWDWMQTIIGLFILYLTWGKAFTWPRIKLRNKPVPQNKEQCPAIELPERQHRKIGRWLQTYLPFPFVTLGIFQGSLGMLLGATGPLGSALLLKEKLDKNALVSTNAMIMFISHTVKVALFTMMGFSIVTEIDLVVSLSCAAILGSFCGTRLRIKMNEKLFMRAFRLVLTILALRMIALPYI